MICICVLSVYRSVSNWKHLELSFIIHSTISFLIGRKHTVNFRNQRLGRHLAADYTIIMSRTLKVTANHVMYDSRGRGADSAYDGGRSYGCSSEILNQTPKRDRSGHGPSFFWPLKATMLKHRQMNKKLLLIMAKTLSSNTFTHM